MGSQRKWKQNWYGVKIQKQRFRAAGDAIKLTFLLSLFKEMIE